MFGLDDQIATFSDGTTLIIVAAVSILLGLRHASDPDHLAAVTTLIASGERAAHRAARLGFTWGLGHATSLFAFGLPVVLYSAYLPETLQRAAETGVGLMIVVLAVVLLIRWRRGLFHGHSHVKTRSGRQAYAIGVVHGVGGTAGVGVLLLAAIPDPAVAVAALAVFALCSALSMALLSTGFGVALSSGRASHRMDRLAPALGLMSLLFGVWYALGAQGVVPYVL
jgi:High-affinity nickel-transport protein